MTKSNNHTLTDKVKTTKIKTSKIKCFVSLNMFLQEENCRLLHKEEYYY